MFENKIDIQIIVGDQNITLSIFGETNNVKTVFEQFDAAENGEAPIQLKEGCFYEYKLTDKFVLETSDYVSQSKVNPSSGRISPNIYVGTLTLNILDSFTKVKCGEVKLEVQSVKTSYRKDYRYMLEEITDKCIDLLLQHSSPVTQLFEVDFNADPKTLYQRFAFIKSIIDSEEFTDSVHKILSAPVSKWKECESEKDIRGVKRINNATMRQIASATNRIDLPSDHPLKSLLHSVPSKINISYKTETVDTPENRFVKHALKSFLSLIGLFRSKLDDTSRLRKEAILLEDKLENFLSHSIFKEISLPTTLPLNSPILQRKEGYREILRVWLMFDLAAKLTWQGGEDIYSGGKRDVAVLYEYWLFFKLLDLIKEVFKIDSSSIEDLIEPTSDELGLKLKQGKSLPIQGIYDADSRKLNIQFSYNRIFKGGNEYPKGGSWTRELRPDYTLSVWPVGIEQDDAEKEELIVHIHFDAKYKIENLKEILDVNEDPVEEKEQQKRGTYKRADILKMHTYRDAIRRTAGAYVLYPGQENGSDKKKRFMGFHELIPGLGAFAISPSKIDDGTKELKLFLYEVVKHFLNRASQREKMAFKTYETHIDKESNVLELSLPEAFGVNRSFVPDDTYVLVAFYKDAEHLKWINQNKLYNARTGSTRGSLRLSPKETGAKYILLHTTGETKSSRLFKLKEKGPRIFSKQDMIKLVYPNPSQEFYLVYDIVEPAEVEFQDIKWDITQLEGYSIKQGSALPFSISLTGLMKQFHNKKV